MPRRSSPKTSEYLYRMSLDKPMRDHVLQLQAIARVNRTYADSNGVQKRVGPVVDFVGMLGELKKALPFDSSDVSGVIEENWAFSRQRPLIVDNTGSGLTRTVCWLIFSTVNGTAKEALKKSWCGIAAESAGD